MNLSLQQTRTVRGFQVTLFHTKGTYYFQSINFFHRFSCKPNKPLETNIVRLFIL